MLVCSKQVTTVTGDRTFLRNILALHYTLSTVRVYFSIKLTFIFPKYQSCPGHIYITYDEPVPAGAGQDGQGEKFNESRPSHLDLKN